MTLSARFLATSLAIDLILAGCASPAPELTATASATLQIYQSPTATIEFELAQTRPPIFAGASPTPFVHEVSQGDTLLGIAIRYGVQLDQLLAANPDIDPRFLSVGQAIRIPGPDGAAPETILPTSTPVSVPLRQPVCYLNVSGGSVCFALVENPGAETIEGLTAQISLLSSQGSSIATQLAYPPLNLLEPGGRMPLVAHFAGENVGPAGAQALLLSAVRAGDLAGRYADVEISSVETELRSDIATVRFEVHSPPSNNLPVSVVVVAVAYDASGRVVGYRKWESGLPLLPDESQAGSLEVASLGPEIHEVEVLAEARPQTASEQ